MNSAPLVSIVIPAFNPRFFRAALQSALDQTYEHLEIVVCDDCITGEIKAIYDTLVPDAGGICRYVANPYRLGLQQNFLRCLEEAQGEFIKFLCDDDWISPTCIAIQASVLGKYPDVNLVVAKRHLVDVQEYVLPLRMGNVGLSPYSAVYRGVDLLAMFERAPRNLLGGFSGSLMRRADVLEYLPSLAQEGEGFVALLDFTLFICLLRRGNLVELISIESTERVHPDRFSNKPGIYQKATQEWEWLKLMLAARTGESAPQSGWVRHIALGDRGPEEEWDEFNLYAVMADRQGVLNGRVGSESESFSQLYAQWLACRQFNPLQKKLNTRRAAAWTWRPRIVTVVLDVQGEPNLLDVTLQSIAGQDYAAEAVILLSNTANTDKYDAVRYPLESNWSRQLNEVLAQLDNADWIYLLRAGDVLRSPALMILAERIVHMPHVSCVYSDEGALDADDKSVDSVFKPDFNLDLLRGYPYVGRALAFQRQCILEMGGLNPQYGELAPHDAIWRLVESQGTQAIEHIAELQVESHLSYSHWLSLPEVVEQSEPILSAHLQRIGVEHVIHHGQLPLLNRVEYLHPERPLVSIIISVKDQLAALERCVDSLFSKTAYVNYEVLLVDKGSESAETRDWLAAMGSLGSDKLRVLAYEGSTNEAATFNYASEQARGEYLVSLSPHVVMHDSDWLDSLLNHAQRSEVGVVGARILSLEGTVLHAGTVLGMQGLAGKPFTNASVTEPGYMYRLQMAQNWSAVSGNCLIVRKDVFDAIEGMDGAAFSQGLQDIDLCLKAGQSGYLVVWTPDASVVWVEPAAGALAIAFPERVEDEQQRFYKRWLPAIARDPAYNQNLSLDGGAGFDLEPGRIAGWDPFCGRREPSVLALAINQTAVGHYRVTQPFLELQAAGRIVGRTGFDAPSIVELQRQSPDVVVFQGCYSEVRLPNVVKVKAHSQAMRIFELDDYVVKVPAKNDHVRSMPRNLEANLRRGIGMCDRVVVSTYPLAQALEGMHSDIRVVPNMLATHLWSNLHGKRRTSTKPRVGWGGGTSHRGDLEIIAEVVRELADEVEWVLFGMCPDSLKPYIHEFHPGISLDTYPAKLASLNLDLALAPLEFHIFNDCKSNLRLLEYGACGYPVICTDTEAYRGHLPCTRVYSNSTQEWLQAIRMHLSDPDASYRMGDELREAVLRDFMLRGENLQYWVNGWLPD
ncbi:glycosyl transferase family 2 [Pseudomonas sp. S25]|uniref:Glycosyl transferase family 2 n=1 Tax=Pseudomonas maioricensis TaxID=1766623 RepID=A0ABS9ZJD2_9PSED|nr:glycosyl transferase family 2 [Pseudomonas sp. S25]